MAELKKAVIEKVTQALVEAGGAPKWRVRVGIHDMPKWNWGIAGVSAKDLGRWSSGAPPFGIYGCWRLS